MAERNIKASRNIKDKEDVEEDEEFEEDEVNFREELENILERGFSPDIDSLNLEEMTPVLKPRQDVSLERGARFFNIAEEDDEKGINVYQPRTENRGESQRESYSAASGYAPSESYEMRAQTPDGSSGKTITSDEGFGSDNRENQFKEKTFDERVRSYETEQEKKSRDIRKSW